MRVEYRSEEVKVMEVRWYEIGVRGTNALDWMREGKGRQERSNFWQELPVQKLEQQEQE